jgi:hypothetical protein
VILYFTHIIMLVCGVTLGAVFLIGWGKHVPRERRYELATWDASAWVAALTFVCLLWLCALVPHPARGYPVDVMAARTATFVVIDALLVVRFAQWRRVRRSTRLMSEAA